MKYTTEEIKRKVEDVQNSLFAEEIEAVDPILMDPILMESVDDKDSEASAVKKKIKNPIRETLDECAKIITDNNVTIKNILEKNGKLKVNWWGLRNTTNTPYTLSYDIFSESSEYFDRRSEMKQNELTNSKRSS